METGEKIGEQRKRSSSLAELCIFPIDLSHLCMYNKLILFGCADNGRMPEAGGAAQAVPLVGAAVRPGKGYVCWTIS